MQLQGSMSQVMLILSKHPPLASTICTEGVWAVERLQGPSVFRIFSQLAAVIYKYGFGMWDGRSISQFLRRLGTVIQSLLLFPQETK